MSIHIGRVGLYAGMPSLDMLTVSKPTTIGTPTDKQPSVTNVRSMVSIESLPFVRQHTFVGPAYERQRTQSTDISNPDVNQTLRTPMGIHIGMAACTQACLPSTRPLSANPPPFVTPPDRSL